jgi:hypothetical protein
MVKMRSLSCALLIGFTALCHGQQRPNVAAQREAMKKLDFLAGKWSGEALVTRGPGDPMKLLQTEEVQFKMDGLVMLVEGAGRGSDGQIAFRALATISYDDTTATYRFRAYHDGHYLDTELNVTPRGFAWGYAAGPVKVSNTMRLNEKGEWAETTETTVSSSPPRKSVEMTLRRQP